MDESTFDDCLILLDDIRDYLYQLTYSDCYVLDPKVMINVDLKLLKKIIGGI